MHHSDLAVKTFDLNHELLVQLKPFPVQVEEQTHFELRLTSQSQRGSLKVQEAWIEGVNMYMGRISVYVEPEQQDSEKVTGWFFLGSCSEPRMHWRLYVRLADDKGEEVIHFDIFTEV